MPDNRSIFDLNQNELQAFLGELSQPAYRARQLWEGLYKNLWFQPDKFTNFPLSLRQVLDKNIRFLPAVEEQRLISRGRQTQKVIFKLSDGSLIETVLMQYLQRNTVCISSQVGCAMNCSFCATGQMGFQRNLSSGEILFQVLYFASELKQKQESLSNVVVMGMGEPFQNYDATLRAIDCLNDPLGFNLGARRFTISTVGLPERIRQFADEKRQVNLAVSLHAADDFLRNQLVPANRKYPLSEVMSACRYYSEQTSRRITFEWALISGLNDTPEQAHQLVKLTRGLRSHVNIIPLNPTNKYPGAPSSMERAQAFKAVLDQYSLPCTIRLRRGIEIHAGCGQLATHHASAGNPGQA
jgi:23S rRNA (adenine2503-C2)-methyltransferase